MKVFVCHLKSKSEQDKPVVKTLVCKGWCAASVFAESEFGDDLLSISVVNDDVFVV